MLVSMLRAATSRRFQWNFPIFVLVLVVFILLLLNWFSSQSENVDFVPLQSNIVLKPSVIESNPDKDSVPLKDLPEGFIVTNPSVIQSNPDKDNVPLKDLPNGFIDVPYVNLCKETDHPTCEYENEVDFRIIVMVYNRADSVSKSLRSLNGMELDGAVAEVNIWLDRHKSGGIHEQTYKVAKEFKWELGTVKVHTQKQHGGIYAQWIETWRPKPGTKEIVVFLEDDVDLSKYAYRWLKAAKDKYGSRPDLGGFSLVEKGIPNLKIRPEDEVAFLVARLGSNGYTPIAEHWSNFQDWYHEKKEDKNFHPYVKDDPLITSWYKSFEKSNTQNSMWTIWAIYYQQTKGLYTLFPNIATYVIKNLPGSEQRGKYLAFHREEKGLHYKKAGGVSSANHLIDAWDESFIAFKSDLIKYYFHGKKIS